MPTQTTSKKQTKAFLNAPTQKHKQQPNQQQNIPTQTTNKKQTTTQIIHFTTYKTKKLKNHNISTLYTNQYKIIKHQHIHQKEVKLNMHKIKQTRPNGLTQKQNKHNIGKTKNIILITPKYANTNNKPHKTIVTINDTTHIQKQQQNIDTPTNKQQKPKQTYTIEQTPKTTQKQNPHHNKIPKHKPNTKQT